MFVWREREREIKEQFLPVHFYLFNFSSNLSSLLIFSDIHMRTGPLENFFILAFTTIGKTIHVLHTWALERKGLWRNSFHMDKSRPNMLLQTADQSRVQSPEATLVWKGISTERNLLDACTTTSYKLIFHSVWGLWNSLSLYKLVYVHAALLTSPQTDTASNCDWNFSNVRSMIPLNRIFSAINHSFENRTNYARLQWSIFVG